MDSITEIKLDCVSDKVEEGEDKENVDELSPLRNEAESKTTKEKKEKLTFLKKLKLIKDNTTVEPIIACYTMPSLLSSLAVQNLNLEKACLVNLNFGEEVCDALKLRQTENYTSYEKEVQTLVAGVQAWKNMIQTAIPVFLILFVGAWSDKTGRRKACILMPIFGELLTCMGLILNTYFFMELPVEVAVLTESIFPAITGGWYTHFIGIFSYMGDITTVDERTTRVGIVNLCLLLSYPIGNALSGVLLRWVGYYGIFIISGTFYFFCIAYGIYCLEDPKRKVSEKNDHNACFNFLREFFNFALALDTFKVAFRKGPRNMRLRVALLLICVCVIYGPIEGECNVLYLFTRFRFNWDEMQFSLWATYCVITNLMGMAFSIYFFSSYLKLDDTLLGIISCTSKIVSSFAYAFARNDLEIYLAALLDILNSTSFTAMRSIATKLVSGGEFGKINSLFGLAEAMMPLVYGPLYSQVYTATLDVLPGAVFILGSILLLPAIAIFFWLYFEKKRHIHCEDIKENGVENQ